MGDNIEPEDNVITFPFLGGLSLHLNHLIASHTMGGCISRNHKSSNRIELSWLGQDLFNC